MKLVVTVFSLVSHIIFKELKLFCVHPPCSTQYEMNLHVGLSSTVIHSVGFTQSSIVPSAPLGIWKAELISSAETKR